MKRIFVALSFIVHIFLCIVPFLNWWNHLNTLVSLCGLKGSKLGHEHCFHFPNCQLLLYKCRGSSICFSYGTYFLVFFLIFAEDTGEVSKWFYWKLIDWTPPFIVLHIVLCELLRTSRLVDLWTIKHFDHCLPCVIITLLHLKQFCPLLNSPKHVIVSVHKQ